MKEIDIAGRKVRPSKVVCVGRNYAAHIKELGNEAPEQMVVFFKPNAAIGDRLRQSHAGEPIHYEGEICFVFESGGLGYVGFGLDLTKRALQARLTAKGLPWERCKAFSESALFGSFAPLEGGVDGLMLELKIDGNVVQAGGVKDMIYPPERILEEVSGIIDLQDGDVIMTGTPQGVGRVKQGCRFEGRIHAGGRDLAGAAWTAEA